MFVFLSLIKLAIMKYLKQKKADIEAERSSAVPTTRVHNGLEYILHRGGQQNDSESTKIAWGLRVVYVGLVAFPVAFLLFCLIYFVVFINMAGEQQANSACNV